MPLILPAAALLVVLTRPGPASPPPQTPAQTEPADKTKKTDKDKDKDKDKDQDAKAPKEEKPAFRFEDRPALHLGKGTRIDFKARVQHDVTRSDAATADAGEFETDDLGRRSIGVEGEIANAVEFQI